MRDVFPALIHDPNLVYFDSASTTLKPQSVVDAMNDYYKVYGVNVHRGQYSQALLTTKKFEDARSRIAAFIHAHSEREVIFTKNATEALNMAASMLFNRNARSIAISPLNHHSHYLPWTQGAKNHGGAIHYLKCDEHGDIHYDEHSLEAMGRVDSVALTYVSNVTGRVQPIGKIVESIRKLYPDTIICVDATQAMAHLPVDVASLGCDMLAFSGHKMYGPTGIGVLWVRQDLLSKLEPVYFGGGMVADLRDGHAIWSDTPYAFEAGTPPIAEAIALHSACDFIDSCGYDAIRASDEHAFETLATIVKSVDPTVHILGEGSPNPSVGILSWYSQKYHPHDMAELLGEKNIAVRAGHHCAIPLHTQMAVPSTVRASVSCVQNATDFSAFEQAYNAAYTKLCPSTIQSF